MFLGLLILRAHLYGGDIQRQSISKSRDLAFSVQQAFLLDSTVSTFCWVFYGGRHIYIDLCIYIIYIYVLCFLFVIWLRTCFNCFETMRCFAWPRWCTPHQLLVCCRSIRLPSAGVEWTQYFIRIAQKHFQPVAVSTSTISNIQRKNTNPKPLLWRNPPKVSTLETGCFLTASTGDWCRI